MTKSILITGGCGFVGSNLGLMLKRKYPDYQIIAFDSLKRRGSELNISRLKENGIEFIHGDIRSKSDLDTVPKVDLIIDAAAEPSVTAGLNGSLDNVIDTNLNGTINTLLLAQKYQSDFIFLSTSRVYPISTVETINYQESDSRFVVSDNQTITGVSPRGIAEEFPLAGARSYYGATKLACELLIQEFKEFANIRTVINRCGVIAGAWQMGKVDQGVMVLWVARHYWKKALSYVGYGGEGKQVRDILAIEDLFELIDFEIHNMDKVNGELFNAGGGLEGSVSLSELTTICEKVTGNKINIDKVKETRQADIRIYVTDNTYVTQKTGWKPKTSVESIVCNIHQWIAQNEKDLEAILK